MTPKKDFATMSPEDIAALTGAEKKAYEKWLNTPAEEKDKKAADKKGGAEKKAEESDNVDLFEDARKKAMKYFKEHKECPVDSLVICSDGAVFYNNVRGKNAADNHVIANKGLNITSVIIDR